LRSIVAPTLKGSGRYEATRTGTDGSAARAIDCVRPSQAGSPVGIAAPSTPATVRKTPRRSRLQVQTADDLATPATPRAKSS
jgi:hypothetical protein